jgi:hypothetical protein
MKIISAHIAHKLRAHTCRWQGLPEVTVPSAVVSDEQTAEWSDEMYARDLDTEKPSQFRRLAALAALGAILAGAVLGTGVAKASPIDVCASLAASPTVGTVEQLVIGYVNEGLTPGDAGSLIAVNVLGQCPVYVPVLQRFIDAYARPSGRVMA